MESTVKPKKMNRWKLTTALLTILLVTSCFVVLYQLNPSDVSAQPYTLNVYIDGPDKVSAQTPTNYKATINNSAGILTYSWSITPQDNKVTISPNSDSCILTFNEATSDLYTLKVEAHDKAGNFGVYAKIVCDPPTYPSLFLGLSTATYDYKIEIDETGSWYYALTGRTGASVYQSTNASYTINSAITAGSIFIKNSNSPYLITAQIIVPSNRQVTSDKATLQSSGLGASTPMFLVDGKENVTISGLKIRDVSYVAIFVKGNSETIKIDNNYIDNCGFGIATASTTGQLLNTLVVDSNNVLNSYYHGIAIQGSLATPGDVKAVVSNNYIYNSGTGVFPYATGIDVENLLSTTGLSEIVLTNNIAEHCWEDGLHVEGVNGSVTVNGGNFFDNGQNPTPTYGAGVLITKTRNALVEGVNSHDNYRGFFFYTISGYTDTCSFKSNHAYNNADSGFESSSADGTESLILDGNTIENNGMEAIYYYAGTALGAVNNSLSIANNKIRNNFQNVTTDISYGEIFLQADAGTTFKVVINNNEIEATNVHVYAVVLDQLSDYTLRNNIYLNQQRGFLITDSVGQDWDELTSASYTILTRNNGAYWYSINQFGRVAYEGVSLTTVLQNTADSGAGIDIFLSWVGEYNITGLTLSKGNQILRGVYQSSTETRGTTLGLTPTTAGSLITIDPTTASDYYTIKNLRINGDGAGGVSENGIYAMYGSYHVEIWDVQAYSFGDSGFKLNTGSLYTLQNCYAQDCGDRGFSFNGWIYSNFVYNCRAYRNPTDIVIENCNDTTFNGIQSTNSTTYNGITVIGGGNNNFFSTIITGAYLHGLDLRGSQGNNFYGTVISNCGQLLANNYAGIYLESNDGTHSTKNNFVGGQIFSNAPALSQRFAVEEIDANQDWNYYEGLLCYGNFAGVVLNGVNSINGTGTRIYP